jgi:chromosomal replication initiator protein
LELPTSVEPIPVWRAIRAELRRTVGQSTFEIWLEPLEVQSWDGHTLTLQAPPATEAWVSKRFGRVLESCAAAVAGGPVQIGFARGTPAQFAPARADLDLSLTLNPRYRFEQFIIGDGNRLAHAAALAVAELPGQAYNPLFLHAPPGLGKTHLLQAIGNYVHAFGGGATVRYATVEAFTNQFLGALTARSSLDHFKRAYRAADVLLLDDVQFLASKAKTEEEFFHTFNALYETGRQLVLTCDRFPGELTAVEQRLRERFEWGLVADIRPPDLATRLTILRKRAAVDHVEFADPGVLELIAERVTDNVRSLEGALIRIVAHHSLTRRPLDLQLATDVLDAMHPASGSHQTSVAVVQATVARFFDLTVDELTSSSRAARVAWPRQVAIHLARQIDDASLSSLGRAFGGRSHATILHACKRVMNRIASDPEAAGQIEQLSAMITRADRDRDD